MQNTVEANIVAETAVSSLFDVIRIFVAQTAGFAVCGFS